MTETRRNISTHLSSEPGRAKVRIVCPYCGVSVDAFLWSLAGSGKLCRCGAKHVNGGLTRAPEKPLRVTVTLRDYTSREMTYGDRVSWYPQPRGGYGWIAPVAAIVDGWTKQRARIIVGVKRGGEWKRERKTVKWTSLATREKACPELGEAGE